MKILTIRLPDEMYDWLKARAESENRSLSRQALTELQTAKAAHDNEQAPPPPKA